ncbi:hypothetical protein AAFF_G00323320 [Aldrovandia affinis]|uniref:Uncharacterized protein n=1 Tax=Aldrovandia affinis TaxID=143900 RepID=A0AAD7WQ63_9TELE|nr:hypothetical protein AAFF_G00323320 [Aldrovandia affinis]
MRIQPFLCGGTAEQSGCKARDPELGADGDEDAGFSQPHGETPQGCPDSPLLAQTRLPSSAAQEADKRLRAQQSGQQCGPVELRKKEDSFKAQETLKDRAEQPHPVVVGSPEQTTVAQKQQPSPLSISSQTGQQTEKQNGDSSSAGVVLFHHVLKSLDSVRQEADKRLRAQQSGQSGQQCGPVELQKKEDSFKAQAALSTQHQLKNRAANPKAPMTATSCFFTCRII